MTDITQWISNAEAGVGKPNPLHKTDCVCVDCERQRIILPRALAALRVAMESLRVITEMSSGETWFEADRGLEEVAAILEGRDDQA